MPWTVNECVTVTDSTNIKSHVQYPIAFAYRWIQWKRIDMSWYDMRWWRYANIIQYYDIWFVPPALNAVNGAYVVFVPVELVSGMIQERVRSKWLLIDLLRLQCPPPCLLIYYTLNAQHYPSFPFLYSILCYYIISCTLYMLYYASYITLATTR